LKESSVEVPVSIRKGLHKAIHYMKFIVTDKSSHSMDEELQKLHSHIPP